MFQGTVIHGDKYGRELGYPTANLNTPLDTLMLESGVYAAYCYYKKNKYKAALIIDDTESKVEVHMLDFAGDIYGEILEVEPVKKVNELRAFEQDMDLRAKIAHDILKIEEVLV